MADARRTNFAPAVLQGLAELGAVDPSSGDLSLELGISLWLRTSETSLDDARTTLLALRRHILRACGLDADSEPVPMVGRSLERDLVLLVGYVADLLERAAMVAGCALSEVARRVIAALPQPIDTALGA